MEIHSASYVKGIIGTDKILYNGKFQVAFLGRSNVGKSSLINSLTKKPTLARSSANPGKTVCMDFFLINDAFYFVDFPGYGYARRSAEKRDALAKMMLWYLQYSEVTNRFVVLIIDAKVDMTEQDKEVLKTLREEHVAHVVVANKIDNLEKNQKEAQLTQIQNSIAGSELIAYSSKAKYGRGELLQKIFQLANPH